MAFVQLADIINTTVFRDLASENTPEKTAWFRSGIVTNDPLFDGICAAPGQTSELPYWKDLNFGVEPNYSTDTSAVSTPQKVSQNEQKARKSYLNQSWSAMDLARDLQRGTDAMQHIRNRVDAYWTSQLQRRLIAMARGVLAANTAGNFAAGGNGGTAGDMVVAIAAEAIGSQSPATKYSRAAFVNAAFTMGDKFDAIAAIAVHSVIYKAMIDNNDIDFIIDSAGMLTIPTYMGKSVIVDDLCPVINGTTSGFKYVSMLFGDSMFAWGKASPTVPVEIFRNPDKGNGGGQETLYTRKQWLVHPIGHSNKNVTATGGSGESQTLADLILAANWERTHYRKNVPLAFLVTN